MGAIRKSGNATVESSIATRETRGIGMKRIELEEDDTVEIIRHDGVRLYVSAESAEGAFKIAGESAISITPESNNSIRVFCEINAVVRLIQAKFLSLKNKQI